MADLAAKPRGDNRAYVLRRLLAAGDVVALLGTLAIANLINVSLHRGSIGSEAALIFVVLLPAWIGVASLLGLYHLSDRRVDYSAADEIGPVALAATVWAWIFLLARTVIASEAISVLPSITAWGLMIVLVLAARTIVRLVSRGRMWYRQRVAVLGSPLDVGQVVRRIRRHPDYGLDVVRLFEIEDGQVTARYGIAPDALPEPESTPVDLDELVELATAPSINRVIVATAPERLDERSALIRGLTRARVHVDVVAGDSDAFASNAVLHYVEGLPILTSPSVQAPKTLLALKRVAECAISAVTLLLLSPLLAYIAVRIKLDSPGPVLFRQRRIGRLGCSFELLKFRTMVVGADARKEGISALNIHAHGDGPSMFKVPDDPRITRFGATLRRWSLDELPQLWNVLRGEMSLVGPRPLIPEEASLVRAGYEERFRTRPGVTGPWQTLGRSDVGLEDMIKLDYTYVLNWSFGQDFRILMRTASAVVRGRGAY